MSKIKIERAHNLSLATAIEKANGIGIELQDEFGLQATWKSDTIAYVNGKGINGTMTISDSKIVIEMKLGFALRLFAKNIEKGVTKRLEETLRS